MYVLLGGLVAMAMAMAPSGDPRAIDPAANRPEIVAPGGGPTTVPPAKTRPPKTGTTPSSQVEPKPEATVVVGPKTEPGRRNDSKDDLAPEPQGPGRTLRGGGIGATSVGVALLGTGIGFMLAPQFPVPEEPISNYSLRPPGVVLVTVGAVATVTGIVMIVAGRVVGKKAKTQTARVKLAPGGLRW